MDLLVDRRSFLARAAAMTAATTVGAVALPAVSYAGELRVGQLHRGGRPAGVPRRARGHPRRDAGRRAAARRVEPAHRWRVQQRTAARAQRGVPAVPARRLRGFGVSVTGWLQGALLGADELLTGQRAKLLLLERVLDGLFGRCDVVVQTGPVPFDIIGLPELALPIGFTPAGVPIGTILGGLPYAEDRLLSIAAAYQASTDWHLRRPADPPGAAPPATTVDGRPPHAPRSRAWETATAAPSDPARGRLTAEDVSHLMQ